MMNIKLFYFSGIGNSLIVAKDIAKKVKADLVSIPKIINTDKIHIDAECIGIIVKSVIPASPPEFLFAIM